MPNGPLPNEPLPFSLETPDDQTTRTLNSALYAVTGAPPAGVASGPVDLRFEYRDSAGIEAVKQFHFNPSSYVITFGATVRAAGQEVTPTIQWGPAVGDAGEVSRYTQRPEGLIDTTEKVQRLTAKDLAKQAGYEGDFRFAGVDDNYFMTIALRPPLSRPSALSDTLIDWAPAVLKVAEKVCVPLSALVNV